MIPSNLISVKYTQGNEFLRADTYASYQGYYYEINGKTYIGKEYSLSSIELLKTGTKQINPLLNNSSTFTYGAISGQNVQSVNVVSIPFAANSEDLSKGYKMRYFVKKTNENLIKETNQPTYNQVKNNSLYQSIEIKYDLTTGYKFSPEHDKQVPGVSTFITSQEISTTSMKGQEGIEKDRSVLFNVTQTDLPAQSTTDTPDPTKGRKAEAPNISAISDSYILTVDGPFYGYLNPPGKNGKPEIIDKLAVFKSKDGKWAFVGIQTAKPLLAMIKFAKQDGIDLLVTNGFRPALSPPDRVYADIPAIKITDTQRQIYGISKDKGITANAPSQECLYEGWIARKQGFNLAADPRSPKGGSNHSKSKAFDLNVGTANPANSAGPLDRVKYQWLIDYGWIFGFIRTVPKEEWHWEYRPGEYQFSFCAKSPNDFKLPWWDKMRLNPTPEVNKKVAEIKAALAAGNIPNLPSTEAGVTPSTPILPSPSSLLPSPGTPDQIKAQEFIRSIIRG